MNESHVDVLMGGIVGIAGSLSTLFFGLIRDAQRSKRERKSKAIAALYAPVFGRLKTLMILIHDMEKTAVLRDNTNPGALNYSEEHTVSINNFAELKGLFQREADFIVEIIRNNIHLSHKRDIHLFEYLIAQLELIDIKQKMDRSIGPNIHKLINLGQAGIVHDQLRKRAEKLLG